MYCFINKVENNFVLFKFVYCKCEKIESDMKDIYNVQMQKNDGVTMSITY